METPELLSDFKAAALSVTNLYKTATASQSKARAAGYQDAVEDLLAFLDQENLGLMDGEGWRVRQWATERLLDDGVQAKRNPAASEDDPEEAGLQREETTRSSSPETQKKPPPMPVSSSEMQEPEANRRTATSEPPPSGSPIATQDFTFRSSHVYPTNHDRDSSATGMDLDTTTTAAAGIAESNNVRLVPRPSRGSRHNRRSTAMNSNNTTINFNLGAGAGNKRKMPYADFFDITDINFDSTGSMDGNGFGGRGGKRGKHV